MTFVFNFDSYESQKYNQKNIRFTKLLTTTFYEFISKFINHFPIFVFANAVGVVGIGTRIDATATNTCLAKTRTQLNRVLRLALGGYKRTACKILAHHCLTLSVLNWNLAPEHIVMRKCITSFLPT